MKTEEAVTAVLEGAADASPLGSHASLDEFALAYHQAAADRLSAEPTAMLGHASRTLTGGLRAIPSGRGSELPWKSGGGF